MALTFTKRVAKRASLFARPLGAVRSASSNSTSTSCSHATDRDDDDDDQQQQQRRPVALVVDALRHFHRQHQHFVVPYNFEIPSAPHPTGSADQQQQSWPEHLRGVKLGRAMRGFVKQLNSKRASAHRSHTETTLQQLRAMGFPVQVADWKQFSWEQVSLSALQTFKATEGHLRVPRKFIVPENDDRYAKPTWGYKLGAHVNQLRAKRESLPENQLDALDDIGLIWNVTDDKWENQFLPALRKFRELNGHVNVPQVFKVPCEDGAWPRELWGFALGRMVNQTRSGDIYYPQIEHFLPELAKLGFSFSSIESTWDEKILPSLQVFQSVHGHCYVDKYFMVPHEEPWPQQAWGSKLGFIVHNIRSRGDFFQLVGRDMEKLEQLGFVWNTSEAKWRQRILPSLKAFVQVHGHTNIPRSFIVPARQPWPPKAWGTDLGRVASDASYQRKYADYIDIERSQLEALGFFWATGVAQDDHEDSDSESDSD
ncbi:hypothetical protein Gpo141_00008554 [Globisporangium polare]